MNHDFSVLLVQVPALRRKDVVAELLHNLLAQERVALVLSSRPLHEQTGEASGHGS